MMTTRQIINAIHEGWPIEETKNSSDAPTKRDFSSNFGKYFGHFESISNHPKFKRTSRQKKRVRQKIENATSCEMLVNSLQTYTSKALQKFGSAYCNALKRDIPDDYEMLREQLWQRGILIGHPSIAYEQQRHPEYSLPEHQEIFMHGIVCGGIRNVAYHTWALLCAAPAVFQKEQEVVLSTEEWSEIGESTLPLTTALSSSNQEIFDNGIQYALWEPENPADFSLAEKRPYFYLPPFHPDALTLHGTSMHLSERIIQPARRRLQTLIGAGKVTITEKRRGCAGMDMFPVVHRHIMKDAKEHLFSQAKRILSLPQK